jgi:hypothetical protein
MPTRNISTYLRLLLKVNFVVAGLTKLNPIEPRPFPSKWVDVTLSITSGLK